MRIIETCGGHATDGGGPLTLAHAREIVSWWLATDAFEPALVAALFARVSGGPCCWIGGLNRYRLSAALREALAEKSEPKPRCLHLHIVGTDIGWACLGEGCGAVFSTSVEWAEASEAALS